MIFCTLAGNEINLPLGPYRINWRKQSLSKFQTRIKAFLWKYFRDSGQWFEEVPLCGKDLTRLRWDFLCVTKNEKVFIEVQGSQHFKRNPKFQPNAQDFDNQLVKDQLKVLFAEKNSKLGVVEFFEDDPPITLEWFRKVYPEVEKALTKGKSDVL
jgi:hypothetical protein